MKSVRGFTMIEILVVISIIGILAAVIYASFGEAREDSQNKALRAELKETQLALELYRSQNGEYPDRPGGCGSGSSVTCGANNYIDGLTPDFISELPDHEKSANANCDIVYTVAGDQSWYKLTAQNCIAGADTQAEGVQPTDDMARCPGTCPSSGDCDPSDAIFYQSIAVYSDGGQCE